MEESDFGPGRFDRSGPFPKGRKQSVMRLLDMAESWVSMAREHVKNDKIDMVALANLARLASGVLLKVQLAALEQSDGR